MEKDCAIDVRDGLLSIQDITQGRLLLKVAPQVAMVQKEDAKVSL